MTVTLAPADAAPATPLARSLALSAGLSLAERLGSGPDGRILVRDIAGVVGLVPPRPDAPARPSPAPQIGSGAYDLVPLGGMRETIARRMGDSFRDVPHFPLSLDVEIDAQLALRERLNATLSADGVEASLDALVIKAAAATLQRVPEANASFSPDGLIVHRDINIAFAVAIDGGLITPIIRKANEKGVGEIAAETRDLAQRARARDLTTGDLQGGSLTVSNPGMFGVKSFASIINEAQGAILSVGAADRRPVVRGDALSIATVLTATLTCDHRAMDGAVAAQWIGEFKSLMEEPLGMLL